MDFNTENPVYLLERQAMDAGISINALCRSAKVARSTFTRWKNQSNSPTYSIVKRLERALSKLDKAAKQKTDKSQH